MEMAQPCHRPRNNSLPAETVAGNEDLIVEILLRVPAQTLLTFKCVSKQWRSLISSPDFCQRHTLQNPNSTISGIFLRTSLRLVDSRYELLSIGGYRHSEAPFRFLDFTGVSSGITIIQSCNGLLLCCTKNVFGGFGSCYVCNPTTKRYFKLPPPIGVDERVSIVDVGLAFEPTKSLHYKVVCIQATRKPTCYHQIEIYSSEKRCWRVCGEPFSPPYDMPMVFNGGVFCSGAIHWVSSRGEIHVDLEKECFYTIPTVMGNLGWRRCKWFGECRGHLHMIETNGRLSIRFNVYEMEKDYSRWFVKYKVDLEGIVAVFPEMATNSLYPLDSYFYALAILSVVREENEEDSSLLLYFMGKVLSYKFKDKSIKKVYEFEPNCSETNGSLPFSWADAYHYIKSLACV